jgi:hypothetical protein
MGILRHRRLRRQEVEAADGESEGDEYDEDDEGDESSLTTPSAAGLPLTTTENQFDKAKAIGKDVIEKVPSKYSKYEGLLFNVE